MATQQDSNNASLNTWTGGLNIDTHPTKTPENCYVDALNIHILAQGNKTSTIVENEKGNRVLFNLPLFTSPVYEFGFLHDNKYNYHLNSHTYNLNITVTSPSGVLNKTYAYTSTQNTSVLYNDLIDSVNGFGSLISLGYVKIALRGDKIVFALYNSTATILQTVDIISSTTAVTLNPIVPILSNLAIIGIYSMRDEVIIFTTDTVLTGYGQIWKCKFDVNNYDITNINNGHLVEHYHLFYNQALNFSTSHRIIDCITKYESNIFGKIYFTDNYNVLRNINIYDVDCFALYPNELESVPSLQEDKIVINNIQPLGHYGSGKIEYVTQCYNFYGGLSSISRDSRLIFLTSSLDTLIDSSAYMGNSTTKISGKQLQINVNADTNYDVCRLIAIYYSSLIGTPEIRIVDEKNITGDGSLTFYDDGDNVVSSLTQAQFNDLNSLIFSCKNILEKDNLLLASNIIEDEFDIDFDARCVRYKIDPDTHIESTYIDNFDTSIEADDINPYNDFHAVNYFPNRYVYQKNKCGYNGQAKIFGGTGRDQFGLGVPNIEYNFQMIRLDGDYADRTSIQGKASLNVKQNTFKRSFPTDLDSCNQSVIDTNVEVNNGFYNYKSPYISGLFTGYQRDEVYPFAIVFFDKKGRQSFAKWIGDIRMPKMSDYDDNSDQHDLSPGDHSGYKIADYNASSTNINKQFIYALYPEFTVNLPESIVNQISGFSIVRCKREGKDRTILAQGISTSRPSSFTYLSDQYQFGTPVSNFGTSFVSGPLYDGNFSFCSPEVSFNQNLNFQPGDQFDSIGLLDHDYEDYISDSVFVSPTPVGSNCIKKYYKNKPIPNEVYYSNSNSYSFPNLLGTIEIINNQTSNYPYNVNGHLSDNGSAVFQAVSLYNTPGVCPYKDDYHLLNYKRNQPNRYNGNSINDRAKRDYIYCGNFVSIDNMNSNIGGYKYKSIGVTGGDTFVSYFDCFLGTTYNGVKSVLGSAMYFPCESSINLELRYDPCTSRISQATLLNNRPYNITGISTGPYTLSGTTINYETGDLFRENATYSRQSDVVKFYPKPIHFQSNLIRDCEIRNSGNALVGDQIDEWTVWKVNDYTCVNSEHGAIHDMKLFSNNVYFLQDNAFGMININERQETVDSTGSVLVIGSGNTLGRFGYISTNTGTKHKSSCVLANGIFYYDVNRNKIFMFHGSGDTPLTDLKGLHSLFINKYAYGNIHNTDDVLNQLSGALACYDINNNRVIFSLYNNNNGIQQSPLTLSFNQLLGDGGAFESKYSFSSGIYQNHNGKFLSVNHDLNTCMIHNEGIYGEFNGVNYDSYIEFVSNQGPMVNKEFNNLEWDSFVYDETTSQEVSDITATSLRCTNSYQDSNMMTFIPDDNIRRRLRSWRCYIPRNWDYTNNIETDERLKDKYLISRLTFHNGVSVRNNYRFWLYDIITKFIPQNI